MFVCLTSCMLLYGMVCLCPKAHLDTAPSCFMLSPHDSISKMEDWKLCWRYQLPDVSRHSRVAPLSVALSHHGDTVCLSVFTIDRSIHDRSIFRSSISITITITRSESPPNPPSKLRSHLPRSLGRDGVITDWHPLLSLPFTSLPHSLHDCYALLCLFTSPLPQIITHSSVICIIPCRPHKRPSIHSPAPIRSPVNPMPCSPREGWGRAFRYTQQHSV